MYKSRNMVTDTQAVLDLRANLNYYTTVVIAGDGTLGRNEVGMLHSVGFKAMIVILTTTQ